MANAEVVQFTDRCHASQHCPRCQPEVIRKPILRCEKIRSGEHPHLIIRWSIERRESLRGHVGHGMVGMTHIRAPDHRYGEVVSCSDAATRKPCQWATDFLHDLLRCAFLRNTHPRIRVSLFRISPCGVERFFPFLTLSVLLTGIAPGLDNEGLALYLLRREKNTAQRWWRNCNTIYGLFESSSVVMHSVIPSLEFYQSICFLIQSALISLF